MTPRLKLLAAALCTSLASYGAEATPPPAPPTFRQVINKVVLMPNDEGLQRRAWYQHRLNVLNLTWEDTGRDLGSSGGPNISDLTLQVHEKRGERTLTHLLPVIRHPNFTDKTADVPADKLWVRVGNQSAKDGPTAAVPLTEVLKNLKEYLTDPASVQGVGNLLAKRDTHFLVSAQHVFVPLPAEGKVEFNPVLYNYQSYEGAPAVLVLLVTRQGTSATVIENRELDQRGWGQPLFFNLHGQKTLLTAERHSAVQARVEAGHAEVQDKGALDDGADMMLLVQVPLVQPQQARAPMGEMPPMAGAPAKASAQGFAAEDQVARAGRSDVERAVIGHGDALGKFEEGRGLRLRRDERFPVRVTVQFYKASSNGVVSDQDLADAARTIDQVYRRADFVGSLVVPESQRHRPTDWHQTQVNGGT